jgi:transposase
LIFVCTVPVQLEMEKRSAVKIMERTHEEATEALTPEEKVAILRRHLPEPVPISELCDKQGFQPRFFYCWQKEFFENGAAAFQPKARPRHSAEQERIPIWRRRSRSRSREP